MSTTIWYFIKFVSEESHAYSFMAGKLYLNPLSYFKQVECASSDGRMDSTEAIATWWQPHDIVMKLRAPGIGDIEFNDRDLAGPVSMAYNYHNDLRVFCLYAVYSTGFEVVNGRFNGSPRRLSYYNSK
jgi:hypothetical protein